MKKHTESPACVVCGTVLEGPLGKVMQLFGIRRSIQNPNLCSRCGTHLEEGGIVELTVFFADLSGFTAMTNELGPEKSYEIVNSFFQKANEVRVRHDAFIDKLYAIGGGPFQLTSAIERRIKCRSYLGQAMPSFSWRLCF